SGDNSMARKHRPGRKFRRLRLHDLEERALPSLFGDPVITPFGSFGANTATVLTTGHFVNGDPRLDLVAVTQNPSLEIVIDLFATDSQGHLSTIGAPVDTGFSGFPNRVIASDSNGDNKLDLATIYGLAVYPNPEQIDIWFGTGTGGFSRAPGFPI